jgi:hypothetical protein
MHQVLDLTPESYQRHTIHLQERDWAETNCYVDVWIEQLHALGLDPMASMAFSVTPDFEGDQWTFFKYQLNDLYDLYGLEVQELVIWKTLLDNVEQQVKLNRPVLVELDSMFLPDTAGTAYQREHVKSTVSVNKIDRENKVLGYFHAQGYYELSGADFIEAFALPEANNQPTLAPYVEFVKLDGIKKLSKDSLRSKSEVILARQLSQLPKANPFEKFRHQFERDFAWLLEQPIETFHEYAFVTFRQFGACFELAANYLNWLAPEKYSTIAEQFSGISSATKVYQFQLARALNRKKMVDLNAIDNMAEMWLKATEKLKKMVHSE